jgi:hypothetical protein
MNDHKLETLYSNYLEFTDHMVSEHGAMEVAAIMMAQALSIYKSALPENEYHKMVATIYASRDKVKTFDRPITH